MTAVAGRPIETQDEAMPLEAQPQIHATTTTRKKKKSLPINGNNMVLAAMFIGGIAAVYVLKMNVKPPTLSADEQQNETAVKAQLKALTHSSSVKQIEQDGSSSVMSTLHNDAGQRQIPGELAIKNPFVFIRPKAKKPIAPPPDGGQVAKDEPDAELLKAKALSDVRRLDVQSILSGTGTDSLAMISNRSVRVGDRISGWKVVAIESRQVTMTWQDKSGKHTLKHALKMEER